MAFQVAKNILFAIIEIRAIIQDKIKQIALENLAINWEIE